MREIKYTIYTVSVRTTVIPFYFGSDYGKKFGSGSTTLSVWKRTELFYNKDQYVLQVVS